MDKIFLDQSIPLEAVEFFHIMAGRLLFKLKAYDNWQVLPRLDGIAGAGKSTILEFIKLMFSKQHVDVGIMNNVGRQNFALQSLRYCRLFIIPDMDSNFTLPPTFFNELVSGGSIQMDLMFNGEGKPMEWDRPGIAAGNKPPKWPNAGGCADRVEQCQRRAVARQIGRAHV